MNPLDVNPNDWGLYYNHCFMLHDDLGVVETTANSGEIFYKDDDVWKPIDDLEALSPFWPAPMSLNLFTGAVYVARTQNRTARRSATCDHYWIAWGDGTINQYVMERMHTRLPYPRVDQALRVLEKQGSVAISSDVILSGVPDDCSIIFKGKKVTSCDISGSIVTLFDKSKEKVSPVIRRIIMKLSKVGFICR